MLLGAAADVAVDFDSCENCYNTEDLDIILNPDDHQSTHPLIRYIYAPTGILLQRQRTHAINILKELLDAMEVEPSGDEDINEGTAIQLTRIKPSLILNKLSQQTDPHRRTPPWTTRTSLTRRVPIGFTLFLVWDDARG